MVALWETVAIEVYGGGVALERALFECALRLDLTGGVERLAEALANGASDADARRLSQLARVFGPRGFAAERRLASLARTLEIPLSLEPAPTPRQPIVRMDPRDPQMEWVVQSLRVAWNTTANEVRAVVGN